MASRVSAEEVATASSRLAHLAARAQVETDEVAITELVQRLIGSGEDLQAARWMTRQTFLGLYNPERLLRFQRKFPKPFLNIGGGPGFAYPFWKNLDSATGPLHPSSFFFGPDIPLPCKDRVFELVYSSHAIEHLNDATVVNIFAEAHRALKPDGALLLKIPDFDAIISAWKANDAGFFRDDCWNFGAVAPTFSNKGVKDGVTARAAMTFCGFWNKDFGDLFGAYEASAPGAYCGPAAMVDEQICALLNDKSPHEISAAMCDHVRTHEHEFTFNHQNAWSESEMRAALEATGFDVISTDRRKIVDRFEYVPKIRQMYEISAFYLATKKG